MKRKLSYTAKRSAFIRVNSEVALLMRVPAFKRYGILFAMACSMVVAFSVVWAVPYMYTAMGFAVWAFAGHLITIGDDLPGGWSNPDGMFPSLGRN